MIELKLLINYLVRNAEQERHFLSAHLLAVQKIQSSKKNVVLTF